MSVQDISLQSFTESSRDHLSQVYLSLALSLSLSFLSLSLNANDSMQDGGQKNLNFVLIDGTWNNSAAMYNRLKVKERPETDMLRWISQRQREVER